MPVAQRAAALPLLVVLTALTVLPGCGNETPDRVADQADFEYDGKRVAPPLDADVYPTGSETEPEAEDAVREVKLDNGATLVVWIDPKDYKQVWQQHSDPAEPSAWTRPELLFTAGAGCLGVEAVGQDGTVAATLKCYEVDPFLQQAPDQGQAVVTTDLADWQVESPGELWGEPVVSDGGDKVTWKESNGLSWSRSDGFNTD